ncbi:MAG: LysR family transcriptional regulator [Clostridia bacterium]|jgi:DNA-binding transcriptional LysR family regulator|nr:LysR family transcriptional regulator [Clostridia bacterium]MCI2013616.1 LysR family transcriptional regulator [Clostridia bacterium]
MELKQLEFFIKCVDCGSLSKAAEKLYTTQPNVSKVIRLLESELGNKLFDRTSRGLEITDYGKSIYEYALNVVKNANLITNTVHTQNNNTFCISTYQSHILAHLLVKLYKDNKNITIKHYQGTVEEITDNVSHGISEIGILYVSKKQLNAFRNVIAGKKIEFVEIAKRRACIFVGPNNPLYTKDKITLDELSKLSFVRGLSDFFSIEYHLEEINVGLFSSEMMHSAVYTNSEHLSMDMLLETDLAILGIDVSNKAYTDDKIKTLWIEGENTYLTLGYVIEKGKVLTDTAKKLIEYLREILKP